MILTITLHCSGRDPYGGTAAISTGYTRPEYGAWADRLTHSAQESGWTQRPIERADGGEEHAAFCPACTDRLLDLAAGVTRTHPGLDTLRDLLLLVNVVRTPEELAAWTPDQRALAERWAAPEHLNARDNAVARLPRPGFLS